MAYENETFNVILDRLIDTVVAEYPDIDTREGSFIYTALAPAALELETLYHELDMFIDESFAGTASREGLIKKCSEIGLEPKDATYGQFEAKFDVEVMTNTRFNCNDYNFYVVKKLSDPTETDEYYTYLLECETEGSEPNNTLGNLIPIDYVQGLGYAQLTECLIKGENEEDTESLRIRYFKAVSGTVADGNVAQYEVWCENFDGIGGYKIFPCWNGANTVKVSILNTANTPANSVLIQDFQEYLDPESKGMGDGVAPIGSVVTVSTATEVPITIDFTAKLSEGYTYDSSLTNVIKEAIDNYLALVAYTKSSVNYMSIGATIMECDFIESISNLTVNGGSSDIQLGDEEVGVCKNTSAISWTVM